MDPHRKFKILRALNEHIGKGKKETQEAIAQRLNIRQSRVSQILAGEFSRDSGIVRRLYMGIGFDPDAAEGAVTPEIDETLIAALRRSWDGSEESARVLVHFIEEIGTLLRTDRYQPLSVELGSLART